MQAPAQTPSRRKARRFVLSPCHAGNCSKNKVMRTESRSSRPTASAEFPSKLPPPLAGPSMRSSPSAEMALAPPPPGPDYLQRVCITEAMVDAAKSLL